MATHVAHHHQCESGRNEQWVQVPFNSNSFILFLFIHLFFCPLLSRIAYVQSTPGVPSTLVPTSTVPSTAQQALSVAGSAYVPSALATLGFTAIAPPSQAVVQPLITGQQPAASISDS